MVTITASSSSFRRQVAGDLQASYDGGGGRDADQQSGVARELAGHGVGVFGGDFEILVGEVADRKFWGRWRWPCVSRLRCRGRTSRAAARCIAPSGFSSFRRRVVPTKVPLVPSMETKCVMRPWVCCQISLAVP